MTRCGLAAVGVLFVTLVTMAVVVALFASDAQQRTDARLTLRLLLCGVGGAGGLGSMLVVLYKLHELGVF